MEDQERLRRLHDSYVWDINAAVGEGRLDLVWQLADQYVDEALELITIGEPTGCERPDCAVCGTPRPAPRTLRRRRWLRRTRGSRAS